MTRLWKYLQSGRSRLLVAGTCLLAMPILALALGLFFHWLVPPFPRTGLPPPQLESWLKLPVHPVAIWQGKLPGYRLDPNLRNPSCLSAEDILKKIKAIEPVTINKECQLTKGVWLDSWSGQRITNPDRVRIIETVPVRLLVGAAWTKSEASGVGWSQSDQERYLTLTPENIGRLMATTERVAKRRGNSTILDYKPWRSQAACHYAHRWARVKLHYQLPVSQEEREVVAELLRECR